MLANAECQPLHLALTHRIREQARSHIFDRVLSAGYGGFTVHHLAYELYAEFA